MPDGNSDLVDDAQLRAAVVIAQSVIHAGTISLQCEHKPSREVVAFLERWATAHDREVPDLESWLHDRWPSGMPGAFAASNIALRDDDPLWRRMLLLRPVCDGPLAAACEADGLTLAMRVSRIKAHLAVRGFEVVPHVGERGFERRLTGRVVWDASNVYMDSDVLDRLANLPARRAELAARLSPWSSYLDWRAQLVHLQQTKVAYDAVRWLKGDQVALRIAMTPDMARQDLAGEKVGAQPLPEEDPQDSEDEDGVEDKPQRRRPAYELKLGKVLAVQSDKGDKGADAQDTGRCWVVIEADKTHKQALRAPGKLAVSIAGDMATINAQRRGLRRLRASQTTCRHLPDFIFDGRLVGAPRTVPAIGEAATGQPLNAGQREAVAKAMAAPELMLLQGPPGTGKTTVIAEIATRHALAGRRVLIASQSNLAVDNALERIPDRPEVRRLRLGNPDRVEEQHQRFLDDRFVAERFADLAHAAEDRADELLQIARWGQRARSLAEEIERLDAAAFDLRDRVEDVELAQGDAVQQRDAARAAVYSAQLAMNHAKAERDHWQSALAWLAGHGVRPAALPAELDTQLADQLPELAVSGAVSAGIWSQPALYLDHATRLIQTLAEARRDCGGSSVDGPTAALLRERDALLLATTEAAMARLLELNRQLALHAPWTARTRDIAAAARALPSTESRTLAERAAAHLAPGAAAAAALAAAEEATRNLVAQLREGITALARLAEQAKAAIDRQQRVVGEARQRLSLAAAELAEGQASLAAAREAATSTSRAHSAAAEALGLARARAAALLDEADEAGPATDDVADWQATLTTFADAAAARFEGRRAWLPFLADWTKRLAKPTESDQDRLAPDLLRTANVVGMTCHHASRTEVRESHFVPFDVVIVDEVSKATPPELLLPMLLGRTVILCGDHRQLPPMFRERESSFAEAVAAGDVDADDFTRYEQLVTASLFHQLFEQAPSQAKATLWTQYRMHPQIMAATNVFYDGRLLAGPDAAALAAMRGHGLQLNDAHGRPALGLDHHLVWLDTARDTRGEQVVEQQRGTSKANPFEARAIAGLLRSLSDAAVAAKTDKEVGLIALYGAQLAELQSAIAHEIRRRGPLSSLSLRLNTVDGFQGVEQDIVIVSLVRAGRRVAGDFARRFERINVALSRARELLVVAGSYESFRHADVEVPPVVAPVSAPADAPVALDYDDWPSARAEPKGETVAPTPRILRAYSLIMSHVDRVAGRKHGHQFVR